MQSLSQAEERVSWYWITTFCQKRKFNWWTWYKWKSAQFLIIMPRFFFFRLLNIAFQKYRSYPGYQRLFSRMAGIFGVGRRPKTREKTSGTERCFLPSPLTFELFIGLHLYGNQIGSFQLWSCGPAREEMSNESHYPQKNKLEFKIHCFKRNDDRITSQLSVVDVTSV